jgi:hypothetical protein
MNTKEVIEILEEQVGKQIVVSAMYNDFRGTLANEVFEKDTILVLKIDKKTKQYILISEIYGIAIGVKK